MGAEQAFLHTSTASAIIRNPSFRGQRSTKYRITSEGKGFSWRLISLSAAAVKTTVPVLSYLCLLSHFWRIVYFITEVNTPLDTSDVLVRLFLAPYQTRILNPPWRAGSCSVLMMRPQNETTL